MHDAAQAPPLVWIDLEMTGLDPDRCTILEIATLVTDGDLRIVAEGPEIAIHHPDAVLDAMDPWCIEHHGASGLTDACRRSEIDLAEAERRTLAFLERHCTPGTSPLCGNSVWQDRRFLARYMPKVEAFLHYRIVDVSSIKELASRWYPDLAPFEKKETHRALDDIRESVAELAYYRQRVFRGGGGDG